MHFPSFYEAIKAICYSTAGLTVLLFLAVNIKSLPLAYTGRLLPSLYRLERARRDNIRKKRREPGQPLSSSQSQQQQPLIALSARLFQHHTTSTRVSLMELDINMHKSNSTFFIDADINRVALFTKLLSRAMITLKANFILAGVQCSFRREIRPFQRYLVSSRILAWDSKWLFVVTYFLDPKTGGGSDGGPGSLAELDITGGLAAVLRDREQGKSVFAVMVGKFVFKTGRLTVPPEEILRSADMIGSGVEAESKGVEYNVEEMIERGMRYTKDCI